VKRSPERLRRDRLAPVDHPAEGDQPLVADQAQRAHLEALARAVEAITPLRARLIEPTPHRPMALRVVNPGAGYLAETIGCQITASGQTWFTWSWAEHIGGPDHLAQVAAAIARVLRPETDHA
jgi:hypothetical protein